MEYEIDVNRLRRDMKEEYVAAMCCGFPMAVVDLTEVVWSTCRTGSLLNWLRRTVWI